MYETMLDKFDLLIADSPLCVAVVSDAGAMEFELIGLKPAPLTTDESREVAEHYAGRGFRYIGVVGLVHGVPRCALEAPLDASQSAALLTAFLTYCQAFLNKGPVQQKDDAVAWLETLHSLDDVRRGPHELPND